MADEQSNVSDMEPTADPAPATEVPGTAAAGETPSQQVPQEPAVEGERIVPLKRFQGEQRAHAETRRRLEQEQARWKQERDAMKQQVRELETKDMDDVQRSQYEIEERTRAQQEYQKSLGQREQQVMAVQALWEWREHYRRRGVPQEVLMQYDNYYDMHDAVMDYLSKGVAPQHVAPPASPAPLGPENKIQTGEGLAPLSREFDKFLSGEKGLKEFGKFRKDRKAQKRTTPH